MGSWDGKKYLKNGWIERELQKTSIAIRKNISNQSSTKLWFTISLRNKQDCMEENFGSA